MRHVTIPGIDQPVSRLALGTMIIGTKNRDDSFALLDAALELGVNTLDTAHVYGGGESERGIGLWLQERRNREKVVIVSKGCHHNADRKRVTPFDIRADLHDSLARLKTDYIDCWMLHRDDPSVPVGPIVETLDALKREGKIRAFGGSNWTHQRIQEANDHARAKGLTPFTASSPNFSLAEQVKDPWGPGCVTISGPQHEAARAWYRANRVPVFAYSSLARGLLSGRITSAGFESQKQQLDGACQTAYCHEVNFRRLDRAFALAAERGLTVPQIATAYILSQPLDVVALVGAANRAELAQLVAVADVQLSEADCAWLDLRVEHRGAAAAR